MFVLSFLGKVANPDFFIAPFMMKHFYFLCCVAYCLSGSARFVYGQKVTPVATAPSRLAFVENKGQWNDTILFRADLLGGALFLTAQGFRFNYYATEDVMRAHDMKVTGSNDAWQDAPIRHHAYWVELQGMSGLPGNAKGRGKGSAYHNYFLGNDRKRWQGRVPLYDTVAYENAYAGIDLLVYGAGLQLKYDFVVKPGGNVADIRLNYKGVVPELQADGSLRIRTSVNEIVEMKPYVYQWIAGQQVDVQCNYRWNAKSNELSFVFPEGYNQHYNLVIDPLLVFATLSGGTAETFGYSAAYDREGNFYAGGECHKSGWVTTPGAFKDKFAASLDIGLSKYNAAGTDLVYSTYLGGRSVEQPNSLVVNSKNELIVMGNTSSKDMPVTEGCWDSTIAGFDIFITKFTADGGNLVGSTLLGGSSIDGLEGSSLSTLAGDRQRGEVWVDSADNIYVASCTYSEDYPVTDGAFQKKFGGGPLDGCFTVLDPYCKKILYSTFIGGSGMDVCFSLVQGAHNDFFVTGTTTSADFKVSPAAYQQKLLGGKDAYLLRFGLKEGLIAGTYLGTEASDWGYKIQLDGQGSPWVLGRTQSPDYPVSPGVVHQAGGQMFVQQMSANLDQALVATKFSGHNTLPTPVSFMIDQCGKLYLSCLTTDSTMPLSPDAFAGYAQNITGFWLGVFNPGFESLYYGTYYRGIDHSDGGTSRYDPYGIVYHSACICNRNFETTPQAYGQYFSGTARCDCGSFKFNFESVKPRASFSLAPGLRDTGCLPYQVDVHNSSDMATRYYWDFGDGFTSTEKVPTHIYNRSGEYTITLVGYNDTMCITLDTFRKKIWVVEVDTPVMAMNDTILCSFSPFRPQVLLVNQQNSMRYHWGPAEYVLKDSASLEPLLDPLEQRAFVLTVTNSVNGCVISATDTLQLQVFDPSMYRLNVNDTLLCRGDSVWLHLASADTTSMYQWSPPVYLSHADGKITYAYPQYTQDYTVAVINDYCPYQDYKVHIAVEPRPDIDLGADTVICWNEDWQLYASVRPRSYRDYDYLWSPADYVDDASSPFPMLTRRETVTMSVAVSTPGGCIARDEVHIGVVQELELEVNTRDTGLCPGDTLLLSASGAPMLYWRPNVRISDTAGNEVWLNPEQSGVYILTGTDGRCYDSIAVWVDVYPAAILTMPEAVTIWEGEHYQISPETNCLYFEWFPSSGLNNAQIANPMAEPEVRTRYYVQARTEQGCALSDSIDVLVETEPVLEMPNAYNPSGGTDLKPVRKGPVTLKTFQVYNRWGALVFETHDIDKGWDGRYKGKIQPLGVYLYHIEASTPKGKLFLMNGDVTLVR